MQVPAASLPPIVATAASQLFVPAAPSATLQLSVLSDDRKYALFTAASPANLVSFSAAVASNAIYAPVPRSQQEGRNIDLPLDTDRY